MTDLITDLITDIKNDLTNRFTCKICYNLYPVLMNYRCECERVYCIGCISKWNQGKMVYKCPYCYSGTEPKLIGTEDINLLNIILENKNYNCYKRECNFESNDVYKHIEHYKICSKSISASNNETKREINREINQEINLEINREINRLTNRISYINRFYKF
jgi:hypothetical protein